MISPGYTALHTGFALLASDRVVFDISGPRARQIVNGLVTNSIDEIPSGRGCYAFALTAKGRPLTDMRVLPAPGFEMQEAEDGAHVWLDVPQAGAAGFRDLLARSVPPIFATVEEIPARRLSFSGDAAEGASVALTDCGILSADESDWPERPLEAMTAGPDGTGLLVRRENVEGQGVDLYLLAADAASLESCLQHAVGAAGGTIATDADWEIVRVERGIPRYGAEITIDHLPQETGQTERAISFSKGCYTGQEVVARIHYRGHVNRLLRGVRLRDAHENDTRAHRPPEPGDLTYRDGREVGRVVTAVRSPRFGPIGLAYVRREIEPGSSVSRAPDGPPDLLVVDLPFTQK